jgi:hypothetical protein
MMVGASSQLGLEGRPEARVVVRPVAEIRITGFRKLLIIKTEVLDKGWLTVYDCKRIAVVSKPARQTFWGWVCRLAQKELHRIIAAQSSSAIGSSGSATA